MDPLVGVGGFVAGIAVAQFVRWLAAAEPPEPTASTTCTHCEAPRRGHEGKPAKCPCVWPVKHEGETKAREVVHFFKPMTAEQWMKYRGIPDGGAP